MAELASSLYLAQERGTSIEPSSPKTCADCLFPSQSDKVVVFERGNLLFIFNFHPTESFTDYRVGTDWAGEYSIVLSSDDKEFGGHERLDKTVKHFTTPMEWNGRKNWLQVSLYPPFLLAVAVMASSSSRDLSLECMTETRFLF